MSGPNEIAFAPATELLGRFRSRELSPVESAEAALEQIERYDSRLNAFCLVDRETTLAEARASEERYRRGETAGLLDGVPVAVKDVFLTRGWPTLRGSSLADPQGPWRDDAPSVAALRRHGAVFVGKTTTPELGWKAVTDSPLTGVTRNPWDPRLTPGGSSGGSSVAITCGMATLALGTDGGGSIRIPAAFCGHPGLKPTWGRVPHWPTPPYGALAHAGPMARTVADNALMLQVITEPDPRDWAALPPESVDYVAATSGDLRGLRIAFTPDLGYAAVHPDVRAAVGQAAEVLSGLGAHVEEASPGFEDPIETFSTLWFAGAAYVVRNHTPEQRRALDPGLAEITAEGGSRPLLDYLAAAARRDELGARMSMFHETFDLLVTPTVSIPPFEAGLEVPPSWPHRRWTSWAQFSYPFNITQQPAASVPCGFTDDGLPIGLQIIGRKYADALVLRAAHAFETAHPPTDRRPMALHEEGGPA